MLNAGAALGRILPNALADRYGQFTVTTPVTFVCGSLMFAMFGLKSVGGVVLFSLFYGFFSGACKHNCVLVGRHGINCVVHPQSFRCCLLRLHRWRTMRLKLGTLNPFFSISFLLTCRPASEWALPISSDHLHF